jgi:hypothetical protein
MSLGPGMIIAGSIVGSGELIATTKVGAEAGFWLLWLIIIGCVIKVFAQVEFGRYTITHSQTPLDALNRVPGPKVPIGKGRHANWLLIYWAIMVLLIIGQQGGIVGAIGQAMSITVPLTTAGAEYNENQDKMIDQIVDNRSSRIAMIEPMSPEDRSHAAWHVQLTTSVSELGSIKDKPKDVEKALAKLTTIAEQHSRNGNLGSIDAVEKALAKLEADPIHKNASVQALIAHDLTYAKIQSDAKTLAKDEPADTAWYGAMVAVATSIMLVVGRYGLIQILSTVLVGGFTLITIFTLIMLQTTEWAVQGSEIADGLSFRFTPAAQALSDRPWTTALAAFGIIGVGAAELIMYPYWCLEKGYAKHTGLNDGSESWLKRARGWVRILYLDAWGSMVVYTFATIAFFLLGAAVLGRIGLNPAGGNLVRTLSQMYEPVFGQSASIIFLIGAFAVLYSTFFVSAAGNARVLADAMGLFGLHDGEEATQQKWVKILSAVWPMLALGTFLFFQAPVAMVLASGAAQAIMLPMLGVAALWFRFKRSEPGLQPGRVWDVLLCLSCVGFLIVGGYQLYAVLLKTFG